MIQDTPVKRIENYLHYYLGCDVMVPDEKEACKLVAVNDQSGYIDSGCDYPLAEIKPLLRPLFEITEEEAAMAFKSASPRGKVEGRQVIKYYSNVSFLEPPEFHYLLSRGFDLFGLIDAGLAIDKTLTNK